MKMKTKLAILNLAILVALSGCASDASRSSRNLTVAADNFEIDRRVVFFNGITDEYLLTVEGKCSIDIADNGKLDVTCKVGDDQYKKHFLGLSDNVSYFVEQLEPVEASPYHYRVIFKPKNIIPDLEVKVE